MTTTIETPRPEKPTGENLGNVLIAGSLFVLLVFGIGMSFVLGRDGEEPAPRDAEREFAENRGDWDRSDFQEVAWREHCAIVPVAVDDDRDAESRFADDEIQLVNPLNFECARSGLFPDEEREFNPERTLVFRDELTDSSRRVREISIEFGSGDEPIELGVDTSWELLANSNGIAVRTEDSATLLSNDYLVSIGRPRGCDDGCKMTVWLTVGPDFREFYPDAELHIYGDRRTEVEIDELRSLPRNAYN